MGSGCGTFERSVLPIFGCETSCVMLTSALIGTIKNYVAGSRQIKEGTTHFHRYLHQVTEKITRQLSIHWCHHKLNMSQLWFCISCVTLVYMCPIRATHKAGQHISLTFPSASCRFTICHSSPCVTLIHGSVCVACLQGKQVLQDFHWQKKNKQFFNLFLKR